MRYADLSQVWSTQAEIAAALGVTQPSVAEWKEKGIPWLRQLQIERVTAGALRAEIAHARKHERKRYGQTLCPAGRAA